MSLEDLLADMGVPGGLPQSVSQQFGSIAGLAGRLQSRELAVGSTELELEINLVFSRIGVNETQGVLNWILKHTPEEYHVALNRLAGSTTVVHASR